MEITCWACASHVCIKSCRPRRLSSVSTDHHSIDVVVSAFMLTTLTRRRRNLTYRNNLHLLPSAQRVYRVSHKRSRKILLLASCCFFLLPFILRFHFICAFFALFFRFALGNVALERRERESIRKKNLQLSSYLSLFIIICLLCDVDYSVSRRESKGSHLGPVYLFT